MQRARELSLACYVILLSASVHCLGQGTLQITFEDSSIPPGSASLVSLYYEAGVWFRPIDSMSPGFVHAGPQPPPEWPDNGTACLQAGLGSTLMFSLVTGSVFDLSGVDLAEYSTVVPNAVTVQFVGYRRDGTIVTTNITTDGVTDGTGPVADFQTFSFDSRFSQLDHVEIPTFGWSLDDLVISIPEPASGLLLVIGSLLLAATCCRNKRHHSAIRRNFSLSTQPRVPPAVRMEK